MARRLLAIPLLWLVAVHALLGGTGGLTSVCFGGHHHHEHEHHAHHTADPTAAIGHCPRGAGGPGLVLADLVTEECTCPHLPVDVPDLRVADRDEEDRSHDGTTAVADAGLLAVPFDVTVPAGRGPPAAADDDAVVRRHRLLVVRTTRLLI